MRWQGRDNGTHVKRLTERMRRLNQKMRVHVVIHHTGFRWNYVRTRRPRTCRSGHITAQRGRRRVNRQLLRRLALVR